MESYAGESFILEEIEEARHLRVQGFHLLAEGGERNADIAVCMLFRPQQFAHRAAHVLEMVGPIPNDLLYRGHRPSDLGTSALLRVTAWLQERAMQAGLTHESVRHIAMDPGADLSENPLGRIRCQQRERRAWDPRLQE